MVLGVSFQPSNELKPELLPMPRARAMSNACAVFDGLEHAPGLEVAVRPEIFTDFAALLHGVSVRNARALGQVIDARRQSDAWTSTRRSTYDPPGGQLAHRHSSRSSELPVQCVIPRVARWYDVC